MPARRSLLLASVLLPVLAPVRAADVVRLGVTAGPHARIAEDARGPYANVLAVRTADQDKPWVATLVRVYHPPEVKRFVETHFAGSVVPAI